jgi:hypothetical protein
MGANNETLNAIRTTPYGIQLEDKSYRNTSEAVREFLIDKLPAKIEIVDFKEVKGKTTITKVQVLQALKEEKNSKQERSEFNPDVRINVDAGNILQRAVELTIGVKPFSEQELTQILETATTECIKQFKRIKKDLIKEE